MSSVGGPYEGGYVPPVRSRGFDGLLLVMALVVVWSFVMLCTEQTAVAIYFGVVAVALAVLRGQGRE